MDMLRPTVHWLISGAVAVGANCEQEPSRMLPLLREMRSAVQVPIAAQPAAFRTTDSCHCFTRQPAFPDELETIQVSRREFEEFGKIARAEGIHYVGGCCGCNAAYIRALARGLSEAREGTPSPPLEEREKPRALRLFNSAVAVVPDC